MQKVDFFLESIVKPWSIEEPVGLFAGPKIIRFPEHTYCLTYRILVDQIDLQKILRPRFICLFIDFFFFF